MAIKTFTTGEVLTASNTNTYLANSGLVYVANGPLATATTNFEGVFTSTFRDYRIIIDSPNFASAGDIYIRMLLGATPNTTSNYAWAYRGLFENNTSADSNGTANTVGFTGVSNSIGAVVLSGLSMDIYGPQLAQRTLVTSNAIAYSASGFGSRVGMTMHNVTTAFDGIQFLTLGATVTGNVTIYGYRQA
jgi:hypothetical protein